MACRTSQFDKSNNDNNNNNNNNNNKVCSKCSHSRLSISPRFQPIYAHRRLKCSSRSRRKTEDRRTQNSLPSNLKWLSRRRVALYLTLLFFALLCSSLPRGARASGTDGEEADSQGSPDRVKEVELDDRAGSDRIESQAGRDLTLPCKFLDKVYSPEYDLTRIVEWQKTERNGQTGKREIPRVFMHI